MSQISEAGPGMALRKALRQQANACENLGSPFMARLLRLMSERLQPGTEVADRLFGWQGDISPNGQSVPLRFAGALHGVMLSGEAPWLAAVYPPHDAPDKALWQGIAATIADRPEAMMRWLDHAPQTNEVRRSAALIPAGHWLSNRFGLPIMLSELGASAGLNLMWDRFNLSLPDGSRGPASSEVTLKPDWRGEPAPRAAPLVVDRRGVDLNPLDPTKPEDLLRLRAYLWADQPDRRERTDSAAGLATGVVDRDDAIEWLPQRLRAQPEGQLHMIYHTVAWQYFPRAVQQKGEALIAQAGDEATADRPLARFSMEADEEKHSAALRLTIWPGGETRDMGRADFHGRWIAWKNG